jgi:pimeloyl-ACP methyl ester carboxylesterase
MSTDFPKPTLVETNGIRLAVHDLGVGDPVVLCHGFPELAYSWRHQLPALAGAGYRAIAPDQRGYGGSDKPGPVEDYDIVHLVDDMCGLLDALGYANAIFVGHDWGALMLWQMALLRPERMRACVAVNIPFAPRRDIDPIVMTRQVLGDEFYIVNFQDSDEADRAFDADPRRFLNAMMRRLPVTRAQYERIPPEHKRAFSMLREMNKETPPGEPLLCDAELDYFVRAFSRGGFTPPINWYRNWSRNWALTEGVEQRVRVPTLFVGAEDDILIAPRHIETMRRHVDDLTVEMIAECGHWTQQERPDEFNRILLGWLAGRFPSGPAAGG